MSISDKYVTNTCIWVKTFWTYEVLADTFIINLLQLCLSSYIIFLLYFSDNLQKSVQVTKWWWSVTFIKLLWYFLLWVPSWSHLCQRRWSTPLSWRSTWRSESPTWNPNLSRHCVFFIEEKLGTSVKLQALSGHPVLQVSGPVLGHARHLAVQLRLVVQWEARVQESSACGESSLELC